MKEISIYSDVSLDKKLMDSRFGYIGLEFGTVKNLCKQYGIKYKQKDDCIEFIGRNDIMQVFMEKLHFSRSRYWL